MANGVLTSGNNKGFSFTQQGLQDFLNSSTPKNTVLPEKSDSSPKTIEEMLKGAKQAVSGLGDAFVRTTADIQDYLSQISPSVTSILSNTHIDIQGEQYQTAWGNLLRLSQNPPAGFKPEFLEAMISDLLSEGNGWVWLRQGGARAVEVVAQFNNPNFISRLVERGLFWDHPADQIQSSPDAVVKILFKLPADSRQALLDHLVKSENFETLAQAANRLNKGKEFADLCLGFFQAHHHGFFGSYESAGSYFLGWYYPDGTSLTGQGDEPGRLARAIVVGYANDPRLFAERLGFVGDVNADADQLLPFLVMGLSKAGASRDAIFELYARAKTLDMSGWNKMFDLAATRAMNAYERGHVKTDGEGMAALSRFSSEAGKLKVQAEEYNQKTETIIQEAYLMYPVTAEGQEFLNHLHEMYPNDSSSDLRTSWRYLSASKSYVEDQLEKAAKRGEIPDEDVVQFKANLLNKRQLQNETNLRVMQLGKVEEWVNKTPVEVKGWLDLAVKNNEFSTLVSTKLILEKAQANISRLEEDHRFFEKLSDVDGFTGVFPFIAKLQAQKDARNSRTNPKDPQTIDLQDARILIREALAENKASLLRFYQEQEKAKNPALSLLPLLESQEGLNKLTSSTEELQNFLLVQIAQVKISRESELNYISSLPPLAVAQEGFLSAENVGGQWSKIAGQKNTTDAFKTQAVMMGSFMAGGLVLGLGMGGLASFLVVDVGGPLALAAHEYDKYAQKKEMGLSLGGLDRPLVDLEQNQKQWDATLAMTAGGLIVAGFTGMTHLPAPKIKNPELPPVVTVSRAPTPPEPKPPAPRPPSPRPPGPPRRPPPPPRPSRPPPVRPYRSEGPQPMMHAEEPFVMRGAANDDVEFYEGPMIELGPNDEVVAIYDDANPPVVDVLELESPQQSNLPRRQAASAEEPMQSFDIDYTPAEVVSDETGLGAGEQMSSSSDPVGGPPSGGSGPHQIFRFGSSRSGTTGRAIEVDVGGGRKVTLHMSDAAATSPGKRFCDMSFAELKEHILTVRRRAQRLFRDGRQSEALEILKQLQSRIRRGLTDYDALSAEGSGENIILVRDRATAEGDLSSAQVADEQELTLLGMIQTDIDPLIQDWGVELGEATPVEIPVPTETTLPPEPEGPEPDPEEAITTAPDNLRVSDASTSSRNRSSVGTGKGGRAQLEIGRRFEERAGRADLSAEARRVSLENARAAYEEARGRSEGMQPEDMSEARDGIERINRLLSEEEIEVSDAEILSSEPNIPAETANDLRVAGVNERAGLSELDLLLEGRRGSRPRDHVAEMNRAFSDAREIYRRHVNSGEVAKDARLGFAATSEDLAIVKLVGDEHPSEAAALLNEAADVLEQNLDDLPIDDGEKIALEMRAQGLRSQAVRLEDLEEAPTVMDELIADRKMAEQERTLPLESMEVPVRPTRSDPSFTLSEIEEVRGRIEKNLEEAERSNLGDERSLERQAAAYKQALDDTELLDDPSMTPDEILDAKVQKSEIALRLAEAQEKLAEVKRDPRVTPERLAKAEKDLARIIRLREKFAVQLKANKGRLTRELHTAITDLERAKSDVSGSARPVDEHAREIGEASRRVTAAREKLEELQKNYRTVAKKEIEAENLVAQLRIDLGVPDRALGVVKSALRDLESDLAEMENALPGDGRVDELRANIEVLRARQQELEETIRNQTEVPEEQGLGGSAPTPLARPGQRPSRPTTDADWDDPARVATDVGGRGEAHGLGRVVEVVAHPVEATRRALAPLARIVVRSLREALRTADHAPPDGVEILRPLRHPQPTHETVAARPGAQPPKAADPAPAVSQPEPEVVDAETTLRDSAPPAHVDPAPRVEDVLDSDEETLEDFDDGLRPASPKGELGDETPPPEEIEPPETSASGTTPVVQVEFNGPRGRLYGVESLRARIRQALENNENLNLEFTLYHNSDTGEYFIAEGGATPDGFTRIGEFGISVRDEGYVRRFFISDQRSEALEPHWSVVEDFAQEIGPPEVPRSDTELDMPAATLPKQPAISFSDTAQPATRPFTRREGSPPFRMVLSNPANATGVGLDVFEIGPFETREQLWNLARDYAESAKNRRRALVAAARAPHVSADLPLYLSYNETTNQYLVSSVPATEEGFAPVGDFRLFVNQSGDRFTVRSRNLPSEANNISAAHRPAVEYFSRTVGIELPEETIMGPSPLASVDAPPVPPVEVPRPAAPTVRPSSRPTTGRTVKRNVLVSKAASSEKVGRTIGNMRSGNPFEKLGKQIHEARQGIGYAESNGQPYNLRIDVDVYLIDGRYYFDSVDIPKAALKRNGIRRVGRITVNIENGRGTFSTSWGLGRNPDHKAFLDNFGAQLNQMLSQP